MDKIPDGARPPDLSPDDVRMMNLRFVQRWEGEHRDDWPSLVGVNTGGNRPPLFWIFQGEGEFRALAGCLHRDQPLYGMKSVVYSAEIEDLQQAWSLLEPEFLEPMAADLRRDLLAAAGTGPFILGGNCAGSVMALYLARTLPRRPERLILMNLLRDGGAYDGPVELFFGRHEAADFDGFEIGAAAFPDHRRHALGGPHGSYFRKPGVWSLARLVDEVAAKVS